MVPMYAQRCVSDDWRGLRSCLICSYSLWAFDGCFGLHLACLCWLMYMNLPWTEHTGRSKNEAGTLRLERLLFVPFLTFLVSLDSSVSSSTSTISPLVWTSLLLALHSFVGIPKVQILCRSIPTYIHTTFCVEAHTSWAAADLRTTVPFAAPDPAARPHNLWSDLLSWLVFSSSLS